MSAGMGVSMGQQPQIPMKHAGRIWTRKGADSRTARSAAFRFALTLLAALAFATPPARAAVTEAWVQRYNGPANSSDQPSGVVVDRSGNVIVTGGSSGGTNSSDYYTAKYAGSDGTLIWEQRYNGPVGGPDGANALALDASDNVVVTGFSTEPDNVLKYYTAKYAATNGMLMWEKRYLGSGDNYRGAQAVTIDRSNNVIVTGYSGTLKYAGADGALLWDAHSVQGWAVAVDGGNNVVVTGAYGTSKYAAADGALIWEQRTNAGLSVVVDYSGNVVMAGTGRLDPTKNFYVAKYAGMNGTLLWDKQLNDGIAYAVAVDFNNDVIATGYVGSDYYTAKYAAPDGALLWQQGYNGPANTKDRALALVLDGSGNAVVTGFSAGNGSSADYYTAKYAATNGSLIWESRYNGPANSFDSPGTNCLALGPNGMVVVTGATFNSNFTTDFATVVYRENLPAASVHKVDTGVRLRFPGVADQSYQVQRAPSVTGPWSTNATLTAVTNGPLEYLDTKAPPGSAFYRTSTGP